MLERLLTFQRETFTEEREEQEKKNNTNIHIIMNAFFEPLDPFVDRNVIVAFVASVSRTNRTKNFQKTYIRGYFLLKKIVCKVHAVRF